MVIDLEHFASWRVQHPVLIGYRLQDGNSAKLLIGCSIVYQASHFWVLYHGIGPVDSMPMCPLVRLLGYKVVPGLDFIFKKLFHLTRDKEAILNRVCWITCVCKGDLVWEWCWHHESSSLMAGPGAKQVLSFYATCSAKHLLQRKGRYESAEPSPSARAKVLVYLTCLHEEHREFIWFLGWGRKGIRIKILFQVSISTYLKVFFPFYAMFFHPNCKSRNYPQGSLINKDWGCRACCHWPHSPAWLNSLKNLPLDKFYILLHLHNPRNYIISSLKNNDVVFENARQISWLCIT